MRMTMNVRHALPLAVLTLVASGCTCAGLGVDTTRFACAKDAECATGFECRDVGQGPECVRAGTTDDGGSTGGGTGGGATGGGTGGGNNGGGTATGGGTSGGGGGSTPNHLAFTSAPQNVSPGACSAPLVVETRDAFDAPIAVTTDTTLSLSADAGAATVSFYAGAGCSGAAATDVTVLAGSSSTSFSARADLGGPVTVTVMNPQLGAVSQLLLVVPPPDTLVFVTTPPNPVRAGECLAMTVEARAGTVASPVAADTTVGLTVVPAGAVKFYSDATCTSSTTTTTIPSQSARANVFVKPLTGTMATVSAAAPFATATQDLNITPMVRRGPCDFGSRTTLADGGTRSAFTTTCTFTPALTSLNSSFLLMNAASEVTTSQNGTGLVRCRLGSTNTVSCSRSEDNDTAQVHYQVVEIPLGLRTQRITTPGGGSGPCGPSLNVAPNVDPTKSFVLKAASATSVNFDDEELPTVELVNGGSNLRVVPSTCSGLDLQVLEWNGVTVTRGGVEDGGIDAGEFSRTFSGLPAASGSSTVLVQPSTTTLNNRAVCSSLARATLTTPTTLDVFRAVGDAGCPLSELEVLKFERIDFGSKAVVAHYDVTLPPGQAETTLSITPVDATRAVVFATSQAAGGQGSGETDQGSFSTFSDATARFIMLNGSSVRVVRATSNATSRFTFAVVEFDP
ncbi:MAG: hypothetical protein U0228_30885 [Myxococcaceae bacterium]